MNGLMARMRSWPGRLLLAVAAALALSACDAIVEVNATASVPARYQRVLVTVEQVWFHEDADAPPEDGNWEKRRLDDAVTLDLVRLDGGAFAQLVDDIVVPSRTWRQVRLVLADTHGRLRDSAEQAGAEWNNEVSWYDEDGELATAPLEVLAPEQGIGMALELEVVEAVVSIGGGSATNTVEIVFDAAHDLTELRYGRETRFLLNATLRAHAPDTQHAGAITGTLGLSQLVIDTPTGRPDVQVTAQRFDAALGRRLPVASAAVSRDGRFFLYPLALDEGERTTDYDLVIHGPGVQTVIIEEVPVRRGGPGNAVAVSLGLQPADAFKANVLAGSAVEPRGARVGFYQTPQGAGDPFLVAMATVDPLSGRFAEDIRLSRASTVLYGKWSPALNLRTVSTSEGQAGYAVAAYSPHYGVGGFAAETLRPARQALDTAFFTVPPISLPAAPALPGLVSTTVTVERPGRYDHGALLVTRDGALVTMAPLEELLQQVAGSAFLEASPVPAGSEASPLSRGLYYLDAWTWHSSDEEDTFTRHRGAAAVDLRSSGAAESALLVR